MTPRIRARTVLAVLGVAVVVPATAAATLSSSRPQPKILSASWGTDGKVSCPNGATGLDNIPVTFNWFIRGDSVQPADFQITRSDGTTVTPTCALQFPPNEPDEAQTVNLIGDFGDSVHGPTPKSIRVVGTLEGQVPGATTWTTLPKLPKVAVDPIAGGPYIVDAWKIPASIYKDDQNRCTTGKVFVRVMWSNGLTAYPTGEEVGSAVVGSYRATYKLKNGKSKTLKPLAVADLHDHASAFNSDNMHDLCLPQPPSGSKLSGIRIGAKLIQDPNGDPNDAQKFAVP
jgi:hypothetical protein